MIYYALTSLTTVGFGDVYPKDNFERIIIAMFLLVGVNIFSLVAGEFQNILNSYLDLITEYDDCTNLERFLSLFKKFNQHNPINCKI